MLRLTEEAFFKECMVYVVRSDVVDGLEEDRGFGGVCSAACEQLPYDLAISLSFCAVYWLFCFLPNLEVYFLQFIFELLISAKRGYMNKC
jgi:hypothetical protein